VGRVTAPEPLTASHETGGFACGIPSLDDWLKKQALKNEVSGASRTYAVCENGSRNVVGFYALATGSVASTGRLRAAERCNHPHDGGGPACRHPRPACFSIR
jgi:hypothetical protein